MLDEDTRPKTLWSQTQFDLLYIALDRCKPDGIIKEIMVDLNKRGFPPDEDSRRSTYCRACVRSSEWSLPTESS